MYTRLLLCCFLLAFVACTDQASVTSDSDAEATSATNAPATTAPAARTAPREVRQKDLGAEELPALRAGERVVAAKEFHDNTGSNTFSIRATDGKVNVVHQRRGDDEQLMVAHEVKDDIAGCPGSGKIEVLERSVKVQDLNGDGVSEMYFVYRKGCSPATSAMDLYVYLWEGETQYVVSGASALFKDGKMVSPPRMNEGAGQATSPMQVYAQELFEKYSSLR